MTNEEFQRLQDEIAQANNEAAQLRSQTEQYRAASAVPYSDFQVPKSNVAPSSFMSNLGGLLFGGADSGMNEYLSRDQQKAMQNQALMSAAMSLLKNSGYTTQPISLGQALGSAYEAGTAGYQGAQENAIKQMLTRQKLAEMKRAQKMQEDYQNYVLGMGGESAVTPEQAISTPGMAAGPTVERAAMIGQPTTPIAGGGLTRQQRALLAALPAEKGIPEALKLMQPPEITGQAFKGADGKYYYMTKQGPIPATIAPADLAAEEFGAPQPQVVDGQIRMVQYNKKGESRVVSGVMPYEPQSQDIRAVEYIQGRPLAGTGEEGIGAVGQYRQQIAPKTSVTVPVDMTGGQKGFENEMSLGKSFRSEPIYKDFNDMKTAYGQVITALDQGTPIGDVAGATKVMKLLDPGSVVRETELAIAMQASGRLDRLQNYFSLWASGQKLTPTQRDDFKQLSAELYAAAGQAYNLKRDEYKGFGGAYGFKNLDAALGAPATLPSIVRKPPAGAAPPKAATPPSIQDILNKYPARAQ
jgi:hypothetical protein